MHPTGSNIKFILGSGIHLRAYMHIFFLLKSSSQTMPLVRFFFLPVNAPFQWQHRPRGALQA